MAILKWPISVANSTELAIFLEESATVEYIMYIKD